MATINPLSPLPAPGRHGSCSGVKPTKPLRVGQTFRRRRIRHIVCGRLKLDASCLQKRRGSRALIIGNRQPFGEIASERAGGINAHLVSVKF